MTYTVKSANETTGVCALEGRVKANPSAPPAVGAAVGQRRADACPANSIDAGNGNCACSNGTVENPVGGGDRCVSDDLAKCGLHDVFWGATGNNRDVQVTGNVRDVQFCYPTPDMSPGKGCAMQLDWQMSFQEPDGTWVSEGVGVTNASPSVCTLGDQDKEGEKDDCKGGYKGTVNGVETCVPVKPADGVDSKVDKTETTEKTEPDGSKTTTKTETKTTTNCGADGKCTSTTTTTTTTTNPTDPSKNTTNTTTKTETSDAGSHCAKNKTAPECKGTGDDGEKSEFGGSCEAGFQCKGDAIQCAMAKEQHKRMCTLFEDKTEESELYATEKAKDPKRDVTKDLEGNEEVDIASKLSNADALGGGSCVQDLNITVMSTSVTLPLSRLCSVLAQLGYLLIAVSSLAAARILMKA